MTVADFTIKVGDVLPPITATLEDVDGAVDLTNADAVLFKLQPIAGGALTVDGTAGVVGLATAGQVRYVWQAADTTTPGLYNAEWEVTFTDGTVATFPNERYLLVEMKADLVAPGP
jgi:hypothetical protein